LRATWSKRPDLLAAAELGRRDRDLLEEIAREEGRPAPSLVIQARDDDN
jgi:hypothetical protein